MPELTVCAVTVSRVEPESQRRVAPAAAAGASRLLRRPSMTDPPPDHHRSDGMHSTPRFLQGIYDFVGRGLDAPALLDPALVYVVPHGVVAQAVYFRGGNTASELVCVLLMRDGTPMRYFPIGARSDMHVPLRVIEDLVADTRIELHVAALPGVTGAVVVDLGLVEV
jgi:assimilatory nitrate reductase catalytic subunit